MKRLLHLSQLRQLYPDHRADVIQPVSLQSSSACGTREPVPAVKPQQSSLQLALRHYLDGSTTYKQKLYYKISKTFFVLVLTCRPVTPVGLTSSSSLKKSKHWLKPGSD